MKRAGDLKVMAGHEMMTVVDDLAHTTQRSKIINLRPHPGFETVGREHWEDVDPESIESLEVSENISKDYVLTCFDILENLPESSAYLAFLAAAFQKGALIVMTMRIDETDDRQVHESILPGCRALLNAAGLPSMFLGLSSEYSDGVTPCLVSIHEPRFPQRLANDGQMPLAIMSCFNEEDVLGEVIEHWITEGCSLHILDNWSTDHSWPLLLAASERFRDLVTIERFPSLKPASGSWHDILRRKEEIAAANQGRWIIHTDADEIRRCPFLPFSLADSLALVGSAGWNRVDFTVLNHRPVDDRPLAPGGLVAGLPYFEFGTKPGHFIQKKAWLQGDVRINLAASGGHLAEFEGAQDCPYRFVLHHYPLRSPEHARRKITLERIGRWSNEETERGWHSHYNELLGSERIVWQPHHLHDSRGYLWERHGLRILLGLHDLDGAVP
jgi:Glycosyl transferase family 2